MFISIFDLFKRGIGPSSSHTLGPMVAACDFRERVRQGLGEGSIINQDYRIRCILRGSLSYTGRGHATDRGVLLGLHGFRADELGERDVEALAGDLIRQSDLKAGEGTRVTFHLETDVVFDPGPPLPEHPNGLIFDLIAPGGNSVYSETYFSLGGGFILTRSQRKERETEDVRKGETFPYPFDSAKQMLEMARTRGCSISEMKAANECTLRSAKEMNEGLDGIWQAMQDCLERGLRTDGILPGGLKVPRRAKSLSDQFKTESGPWDLPEWLCAYAMAVNEENAAGHAVVTAPTNGAAGVIPAVLYVLIRHRGVGPEQIRRFLLTAAAIGGLIKHRSSISGAEVGCQGEVGAAASMAAAGLCEVLGGSPEQVENAAEIALEHHLGMTCDPVRGLVQVPCIERNGMGAVKAWTAAQLALRGSGKHLMSLDNCIAAMRQTGLEMSDKLKETSRGGLAVHFTEC